MRSLSNSAVLETRLEVVIRIAEIFDNGTVQAIIRDLVARECLRKRKQRV